MAKVHPTGPPKRSTHDYLTRAFHAAGSYWNSIQVGHRGRYSVQRLLSFRDYYERTSPTRVFFVCTFSLIPAFIVAILMECIPLKPPDEGWKANYAFWIRLFISSLPISFGAVFQVIEVIESGVITATGIVVTAVGSSACYVAITMTTAACWKFPVPFGYVFTVPPFVSSYMILLVLSIGPRVLARSPLLRHQLFSQLLVVAAQAGLAIAYPLFTAVFNQLSGTQQSAFIFVLPIIKFCTKQVIVKMAAHLEESVALIVVFSVDVCNVVYVAVCMQTAISPLTGTIMLVSDAFFVVIALRSIYYQADASQIHHSVQQKTTPTTVKDGYLYDLMELIREAFRYADKPNALPVPIRVRAPIQLPLSVESTKFIGEIAHAKRRNAGEANAHTRRDRQQATPLVNSMAAIGPAPPRAISVNDFARHNFENVVRSSARHTVTRSSHTSAVSEAQDGLQTLFHSEYVVMAEYVECAIPVLYGVYLTCLYHLSTAAYYPHTRSLTPKKFAHAQVVFMIYALVEFASFVGLNILLKRKLGFSPMYQLAFVLETQVGTLQGHFFLWVSWILPITLVHNGVDLNAPFT